jgi:nicotinamidase/pyrazinamidase
MKKLMYLGIDNQNGFREGGNLAVNGGIKCCEAQAEHLKKHKNDYAGDGETVDWHLPSHCSFKENGGIWPNHCEQFTHDAAINQTLYDVLKTCPNFTVFTKGCDEDHEEYSVLKNTESNKKLHSLIQAHEIEQVDFAGIAGDYCVKDSMADFHREFPEVTIRALKPFIASIDGGKAFDEFLAKNDSILVMDEAA